MTLSPVGLNVQTESKMVLLKLMRKNDTLEREFIVTSDDYMNTNEMIVKTVFVFVRCPKLPTKILERSRSPLNLSLCAKQTTDHIFF